MMTAEIPANTNASNQDLLERIRQGKAQPMPELGPDWPTDLKFIPFVDWEGRAIPERRFIADQWVPNGCVTSLYGPGGIGKSLLAQQLATACATGGSWLGTQVQRCKVLGIFSEDDDEELLRRQERINNAYGTRMSDLTDLCLQGRVGAENLLCTFEQEAFRVTALYTRLCYAVQALQPKLVIIDNIAQVFGGDENKRAQATGFVNSLAGIARKYDCAVLLLGHPGKAIESQYSGSTGWDASVRSRIMLSRIEPQQGDEDLPPRLKLARVKSNYAKHDNVELVWVNGVLTTEDPVFETMGSKIDRAMHLGEVKRSFMAALARLTQQNRTTSDKPKAFNYAPRVIKEAGLCPRHNIRDLSDAMQELFNEDCIVANHPIGESSHRNKLVGIKIIRNPYEGKGSHNAY